MSKQHVRLSTSNGEIHAMLWHERNPSEAYGERTVVFSHGYTVPGFESRRMFLDIASRLAAQGWLAVLFDYRGSGYSDLEFSQMTFDSEVKDLGLVLDYTRSVVGKSAWVSIWGMSLGTAVAAEVAAHRQADLNGIVLWSLSGELYERFSPRYIDDFDAKGYSILPSGFMVKPQLIDSMRGIDTYASLRKLTLPRLFVNGDADEATNIRMAEHAVDEATGDCELIRVRGGVHGFKGQPELFEAAVDKTLGWLDARSNG